MSYQNNVLTQLSEDISSSSSTIKLDVPDAPYNAPLSSGGTLVLADSSGLPTKLEIITYVSASTSEDVITLTGCARGLEGTIGRAWTSLDVCYQAVTAKTLADINAAIAGRVENDTGGELKASDLAQLEGTPDFTDGIKIEGTKLEKYGTSYRFSFPSGIQIGGVAIWEDSNGRLRINNVVIATDVGIG